MGLLRHVDIEVVLIYGLALLTLPQSLSWESTYLVMLALSCLPVFVVVGIAVSIAMVVTVIVVLSNVSLVHIQWDRLSSCPMLPLLSTELLCMTVVTTQDSSDTKTCSAERSCSSLHY